MSRWIPYQILFFQIECFKQLHFYAHCIILYFVFVYVVTGEGSIETVTVGKGGIVKSREERAISPASSTSTTTPFKVAAEEAKQAATAADIHEAPIEVSVQAPAQAPAPAPAPAPAANDPEKQAPVFEKTLEDKSVKIGRAVKLSVKVSGKPAPKVVFFKNGDVMEEEGGENCVFMLSIVHSICK